MKMNIGLLNYNVRKWRQNASNNEASQSADDMTFSTNRVGLRICVNETSQISERYCTTKCLKKYGLYVPILDETPYIVTKCTVQRPNASCYVAKKQLMLGQKYQDMTSKQRLTRKGCATDVLRPELLS